VSDRGAQGAQWGWGGWSSGGRWLRWARKGRHAAAMPSCWCEASGVDLLKMTAAPQAAACAASGLAHSCCCWLTLVIVLCVPTSLVRLRCGVPQCICVCCAVLCCVQVGVVPAVRACARLL
jgi:hypothetical protein